MQVLDPIPTTGLTEADVPRLLDRCHHVMRDSFFTISKMHQNGAALAADSLPAQ